MPIAGETPEGGYFVSDGATADWFESGGLVAAPNNRQVFDQMKTAIREAVSALHQAESSDKDFFEALSSLRDYAVGQGLTDRQVDYLTSDPLVVERYGNLLETMRESVITAFALALQVEPEGLPEIEDENDRNVEISNIANYAETWGLRDEDVQELLDEASEK